MIDQHRREEEYRGTYEDMIEVPRSLHFAQVKPAIRLERDEYMRPSVLRGRYPRPQAHLGVREPHRADVSPTGHRRLARSSWSRRAVDLRVGNTSGDRVLALVDHFLSCAVRRDEVLVRRLACKP